MCANTEMCFNRGVYVIRVVPLASLPPNAPQSLDYFWPTPLLRGALVQAVLGRRTVIAVVFSCVDIRRSKLAVKRAGFQLKKLTGIVTNAPQFTDRQLAYAEWLAQQYATGLAISLRSITPGFVGKRRALLDLPAGETGASTDHTAQMVLVHPAGAFSEIRNIIASEHEGQILIIVPEIALASRFALEFAEYAPVVMHSAVKTVEALSAYRAVASGVARLIVGTRISLALPWKNLRHVIIEDPQHESYKSDRAPRVNVPDAARELARLHNARVTYLSPSPSVVQRYLADRSILDIRDSRDSGPAVSVVSIAEERTTGNRSIFSRAAQRALDRARDAREPVLVYSTRRAYSTAIRCDACEATVPCTTCGIPMRLHRTSEDMLICYHCSAYTQVPAVCPTCRGGKLRPAGLAGSQRIAETLSRAMDCEIPILDSDLVSSDADARTIWKTFDAMTSPVLVATQMVFPYRYDRTFSLVVVPQADALGSDADFRASERALWHIEKLADFRPESIILQSWEPSLFAATADHTARDAWYANELADRRTLGWPPFTRLVRCTVSGRIRARASRDATVAAERLRQAVAHNHLSGTQVIGPVPSLIEHAGGLWSHHILVKTTLAGRALDRLLSYLPPQVTVDVDPRSIA